LLPKPQEAASDGGGCDFYLTHRDADTAAPATKTGPTNALSMLRRPFLAQEALLYQIAAF